MEKCVKKKIWGLDVLRVSAAIGIMCYHYFFIGVIQGFYSEEVFWPFAFWGELGVDLFFLLSGFVILMSAEGRTPLQFLKHRFVRIYPAFIICSLFTLITGMIMPNTKNDELFFKWINSLTFLGGYLGMRTII